MSAEHGAAPVTAEHGAAPVTAAPGAAPTIPAPGFDDPTRDSQAAFRAILDALAHPTRSYPIAGPKQPPAALGKALGAVALTVLDEECTVWLGGSLSDDAEVAAWLAFHTGVRIVADAGDADFAFGTPSSRPALDTFRIGTEEAPHRSATLVLDIRGTTTKEEPTNPLHAEGPGIDGATTFDAVWADDGFVEELNRNNALFPRGVDLLIVDDSTVAALPRTTRVLRSPVAHPTKGS